MSEKTSTPQANDAASPDERPKRYVHTWQIVVLFLIFIVPLVPWGLPTSDYDEFLFGGDEPWSADRYDAARTIEARRQRDAGADTDLDPITNRDRLVDLTTDEAARAKILLRYRLYSRQPDEMITFQALQRMNPREHDFDPRLYQYGGAYIYLIGGVLGGAHLVNLAEVSGDAGVYLAQPELFGRFYVVARALTVVFGVLTLVAVIRLGRRAAGRTAGWIACVLVVASPVFITAVLEAKPHLPSVCLLLWALLSALDYQSSGRQRDTLRMGTQAGLAFGFVLTGLAGVMFWPVLMIMRRAEARRTLRDLTIAGVAALLVYAVTNPYVFHNLLFNRAALTSNLANSTSMYTIDRLGDGFLRVSQLLLESCGPGVLVGGLIAILWLYLRWPRQADLISAPAAAVLVLCIAIGAGKPAEFARFLLLPAILLAVGTASLLASLASRRPGWAIVATIVALAVMRTPAYVRSFYADAHFANESRHAAACYLRERMSADDAVGVVQEPAPYAVPPLDFARRTVLLLPPEETTAIEEHDLPRWLVLTADDVRVHREAWWHRHYRLVEQFAAEPFELSRIAWANKPVFVYRLACEVDGDSQ